MNRAWHFTDDPTALPQAAHTALAADPARNTVLLTMLRGDGRRGWFAHERAAGEVSGVCLVTAGGMLVLGAMDDEAARLLAAVTPETIPEVIPEVREVRGEAAAVEAYGLGSGRAWRVTRRMRLYRLGELTPEEPGPPGGARLATAADVPLVLDWMRAFAADIGEDPDADHSANVRARVDEGLLHLWEVAGEPVAMASVSRTEAGQARVSPVYTPPAHRARGYGGAVTAAVSRAARTAGATQVLLFTDLANPTSNALYQRLGYRPVRDHLAAVPDTLV
ncbi:GNAT family N-acetyltransferase [Streptomyces sp. NPDC090025]|uniref:GNAT family N-acetyltransferase n=1 Tax=Streptomyces sp. NPDC090025 TaxID=3365922 RepID=UPI0038396926